MGNECYKLGRVMEGKEKLFQFVFINTRLTDDRMKSSFWKIFNVHGNNGHFFRFRIEINVVAAGDPFKDKSIFLKNFSEFLRSQRGKISHTSGSNGKRIFK